MMSSPDNSEAEQDATTTTMPPRSRHRTKMVRRSSPQKSLEMSFDAWLAPEEPARIGFDGNYLRPKSGGPDGFEWDCKRGVWVPVLSSAASAVVTTTQAAIRAALDGAKEGESSEEEDEEKSQSTDDDEENQFQDEDADADDDGTSDIAGASGDGSENKEDSEHSSEKRSEKKYRSLRFTADLDYAQGVKWRQRKRDRSRSTADLDAEGIPWRAPKFPPERGSYGRYLRPVQEETPEGYQWDRCRGVWVAETKAAPTSRASSMKHDRSRQDDDSEDDSGEEYINSGRAATTAAAATARSSDRTEQKAHADEVFLEPENPPKLGRDGRFVRPTTGPPVEGFTWDRNRGVWRPGSQLFGMASGSGHSSERSGRRRRKRKDRQSKSGDLKRLKASETSRGTSKRERETKDRTSVSGERSFKSAKLGVSHEQALPSESSEGRKRPVGTFEDTDYDSDPTESEKSDRESSLYGQSPEHQANEDEYQDEQTKNAPERTEQVLSPAPNQDPYHPYSLWQEPPSLDSELTLYEKHRQPRPTPSGMFTCSLKALKQEFRCAICLGYIKNARVVRECLHRFCEACIEKCLVQFGQRKECPICRVHIPSRRSLAPDPAFDKLIWSILGNYSTTEADTVEDDEAANDSATPPTGILQQAIQHKRQQQHIMDKSEDVEMSDAAVSPTTTRTEAPRELSSPPKNQTPPLIKIELRLRDKEGCVDLDPLHMPFITVSGDASVKVLKSFLRQKYGMAASKKFQVWSLLDAKLALLSDSMQLRFVVARWSDAFNGAYMPLYYGCVDE